MDNVPSFHKSISAVVTLHNKSSTILPTLDKLKIDLTNLDYEIIIVENGSSDNSFELTKKWCLDNPDVDAHLITSEIGLGNAFKKGIDSSTKDFIWSVPADMQFGTSDLLSFIRNYSKDISLYIGSRLHDDSVVVRNWNRKYISLVFNFVKKILINSNVKDTMGTIIGDAKTMKKYYLLPKTTKFFYITELIAYYEKDDLKILEVPVETFTEIDLSSGNSSTVNLFLTPIEVFFNLISLSFRLRR